MNDVKSNCVPAMVFFLCFVFNIVYYIYVVLLDKAPGKSMNTIHFFLGVGGEEGRRVKKSEEAGDFL